MTVLWFNSLENVACSERPRALSHERGSSGKRRMDPFYDRNKNMSTGKFLGLIKKCYAERKQDMPRILRPTSAFGLWLGTTGKFRLFWQGRSTFGLCGTHKARVARERCPKGSSHAKNVRHECRSGVPCTRTAPKAVVFLAGTVCRTNWTDKLDGQLGQTSWKQEDTAVVRQTEQISGTGRKTGREPCEKPCDRPDDAFFEKVTNLLRTSRKVAQEVLVHSMLQAYWRIGALVAQAVRQTPGQEEAVLEEVSRALAREFGRVIGSERGKENGSGFSVPSLRMMQRLHELFPDPEQLSPQLSWSHYLLLMDVEDARARQWYFARTVSCSWTITQLERQIAGNLYGRYLEEGPEGMNDAATDADADAEEDGLLSNGWLPEPCLWEFWGLGEHPILSAKTLEDALLDALWEKLQHFQPQERQLFALAARKKPERFQEEKFMPDMVLYHTKIRCHVLVTLKLKGFVQEDMTQMARYAALHDRLHKLQWEKPAMGIVLASTDNGCRARYWVPNDLEDLFVEKYGSEFPTEDALQHVLQTRRKLWNMYRKQGT